MGAKKATYILAPDYSTAPPPNGPVRLGTLLADLSELNPLYPEYHQPIPASAFLPVDTKHGFTAPRHRLVSGSLGVWGRFCGLLGVDAGGAYDASDTDVFSFERLETHAFILSADYIKTAVSVAPVRAFLDAAGRNAAVYMVTGLKVGIGASLESSHAREKGVRFKIGLKQPGVPAEGGPVVGLKYRAEDGLAFTGSSDFVVAFRVRRIRYKKGVLLAEAYNKGATMLDGDEKVGATVVEDEGDAAVEDVKLFSEADFVCVEGTGEYDDEESYWIVPKVGE